MAIQLGNTIDPVTGRARPVPWALTELYLCREVYHCTPLELAEQPWETVEMHLEILRMQQEAK